MLILLIILTIVFSLNYNKFLRRFFIKKFQLIAFLVSIAIVILWYIDKESGRFFSGFLTVSILGISFYWLVQFICNIFNFCFKVYVYYKESKQRSFSPLAVPKEMTIKEARELLNVRTNATDEEILNSYTKLIANNDLFYGGSSYTEAKIELAKNLLLKSKQVISIKP